MLRHIVGRFFFQRLPIAVQYTTSQSKLHLTTMKTNERQIKIYKYLFLFIGCMSFQQIGSTSIISKMLPPLSGLVTSPPPRIVPAANIQHNQGIIWRLPQNLPDLTIIPAIPGDSPSSVQNPETVKIEKQN